jgi:hypothetical protein
VISGVDHDPSLAQPPTAGQPPQIRRRPLSMWKLSARDNNTRQWAELGEFQNLSDAAGHVLTLVGDRNGALFFSVYVDPLIDQSDAEILCRLEHRSDKSFYLLARAMQ